MCVRVCVCATINIPLIIIFWSYNTKTRARALGSWTMSENYAICVSNRVYVATCFKVSNDELFCVC